jgi:hypothetical protein
MTSPLLDNDIPVIRPLLLWEPQNKGILQSVELRYCQGKTHIVHGKTSCLLQCISNSG